MLFMNMYLFAGSLGRTTVEIARWRGNTTAAYSIIHDDACGAGNYGIHMNADTIAYNRGLVIGAGAIVKSCVELAAGADKQIWEKLERMIQHGHEMISHSWQHDDATFEHWGVQKDVIDSKATLEQNITGCTVTFFVFPYDNYNDSALNQLRDNGYLGARAGIAPQQDRGVNTEFENFDPFRANFDAFCLTEEASIYAAQVGNANTLKAYLDDAIAKKGWALQEMHEVGSGELWGHIRVPDYQAHMDYVRMQVERGIVWNAVPTDVVKYIVTKDRCGTASVTDNILTFSSSDSVDARYATELTILLTTQNDPLEVYATQNGTDIPVEKLGAHRFSFDVDPTKGPVTLVGPTDISPKEFFAGSTPLIISNMKVFTVSIPLGYYAVELFTLSGKKIKTLLSGYSRETTQKTVSVPESACGCYMIKMVYNGGVSTEKIVVMK